MFLIQTLQKYNIFEQWENLSYNSFCSHCSSEYDSLIMKTADFNIALDY